MKNKGLILNIIFKASSLNYGEGIGNLSSLKKFSYNNKQYSYISRQALAYNIREQLNGNITPVEAVGSGDKKALQFLPETNIQDFPELDFFGYLKTTKGENAKSRNAILRISNGISLEEYKGDSDFLTNMGLAKRIDEFANISQSELHTSYYSYSINLDLEKVGIDDNIEISKEEKISRVHNLLDTIMFLYRDIRGRRENLSPLFVIGGLYDFKNPFFDNTISIKNNNLDINRIKSGFYELIKKDTLVGLVDNQFDNTESIKEELGAIGILEFFSTLKDKVSEYYESN